MCMSISIERSEVLSMTREMEDAGLDISEIASAVADADEFRLEVHVNGTWDLIVRGGLPLGHTERPYYTRWELACTVVWDYVDKTKRKINISGNTY